MITSAANVRMKNLVQLKQKARLRKEQGVFLTEGSKMFLEAPKERIREIYVSESFYDKCSYKDKLKEHSPEIVSDEIFRKISDTVTPQGILCVLERFTHTQEKVLSGGSPLLLLLEDIQDPGNLGTIIRTAEGAGVTGIVMTRETVDIYSPKAIRSTMGSIYRMPFLEVADLAPVLDLLADRGIVSYAAHLEGSRDYSCCDYRMGTAFLIGNEGNGLKEMTARLAGELIRIPMEGQVESLNAAIACSVLVYEARRQRAGQA